MNPYQNEKLVEQFVRYVLDLNGQVTVVENVPARVNVETGEQLFSPDIVRAIAAHRLAAERI